MTITWGGKDYEDDSKERQEYERGIWGDDSGGKNMAGDDGKLVREPGLTQQIEQRIDRGVYNRAAIDYRNLAQGYAKEASSYDSPGSFGDPYGTRDQQEEVVAALRRRAMGKVPSQAEMQFQRTQEANAAQQMAFAASMQGFGNAGLQQRNLGQALSSQNLEASGIAAAGRAAEQADAEGMWGTALQNIRAADMDAERIREELKFKYEQMGYTAIESANMASMQLESELSAQRATFFTGQNAANIAAAQNRAQLIGSGIEAVGNIATALMSGGGGGGRRGSGPMNPEAGRMPGQSEQDIIDEAQRNSRGSF